MPGLGRREGEWQGVRTCCDPCSATEQAAVARWRTCCSVTAQKALQALPSSSLLCALCNIKCQCRKYCSAAPPSPSSLALTCALPPPHCPSGRFPLSMTPPPIIKPITTLTLAHSLARCRPHVVSQVVPLCLRRLLPCSQYGRQHVQLLLPLRQLQAGGVCGRRQGEGLNGEFSGSCRRAASVAGGKAEELHWA